MGIVNVTPDSFSDGGQFYRPEEAVRRACKLIEEGADIIDLGGESTRPGATALGWEEEWARVSPVLSALVALRNGGRLAAVPISVDTYHPETAERALAEGANVVNCVKRETAAEMCALCARTDAMLIAPWRLEWGAEPDFLAPSFDRARLVMDPMIGFATTREEDLELLRTIPELAKLGPVMIGASRKRIVKRLVGDKTPGKDLAGNLAIATWAAAHGAQMVRVHDVRETVQALKVLACLEAW